MGAQRIIIDIMNATHEDAIKVAQVVRVTVIDHGLVITKCKVINHPGQDDEKHTLVSQQ